MSVNVGYKVFETLGTLKGHSTLKGGAAGGKDVEAKERGIREKALMGTRQREHGHSSKVGASLEENVARTEVRRRRARRGARREAGRGAGRGAERGAERAKQSRLYNDRLKRPARTTGLNDLLERPAQTTGSNDRLQRPVQNDRSRTTGSQRMLFTTQPLCSHLCVALLFTHVCGRR